MRSKKEFARHKAYKLHEELSKIKGHYSDVHKANFFRSYVLAKAKNTATGLATQSKERMYFVDSGASSLLVGLSSLNHKVKKTIRQSSEGLDIQAASGIVVSDTQTKVYIEGLGAYQWLHLMKDSPSVLSLGRLCNELGYSFWWPTGDAPRLSKVKEVLECSIENFLFPW